MTNRDKLIERITQMSDEAIAAMLEVATDLIDTGTPDQKPECPHCGSPAVIRYGYACGKQRYSCKACGKTFVPTTNTIMFQSHFPAATWKEAIADTLRGESLDHTAARLGLYHQAMFDMRHKILLALQELPEIRDACLNDVAELDETFVLDSYKGKQFCEEMDREPRKHGAVAQKRGISNEYVCICAGVERQGQAYAFTVNRAKPDSLEIKNVFGSRIADGTLVLCDGLKSYQVLSSAAACTVKDCSDLQAEEKRFFHLNTVNSFHSFLKRRYEKYRAVATKYINRYNALFSIAFRKVEARIPQIAELLLTVHTDNRYHSGRDVRSLGLVAL